MGHIQHESFVNEEIENVVIGHLSGFRCHLVIGPAKNQSDSQFFYFCDYGYSNIICDNLFKC